MSQEELCDGREKDETSLKDVRVEKADVGAGFGFAQFLKKKISFRLVRLVLKPGFNGCREKIRPVLDWLD